MSRRRRVTPEEQELWRQVAASTRALRPQRPAAQELSEAPKPVPHVAHQPPRPEVRDFHIGEKVDYRLRHDLAPSLSARLAAAPVVMDRSRHREMLKGRMKPEASLDLHGMTLSEAHPELIRFVMNAHAAGKRLVLVITGKGKRGLDDGPIPLRQGVLRHQVPSWLHLPPLGAVVMQVSEAHLKHGGSGALYVYLRR